MQKPLHEDQFEAAFRWIQNNKLDGTKVGKLKNAEISRSYWIENSCYIRTNTGSLVAVVERSDVEKYREIIAINERIWDYRTRELVNNEVLNAAQPPKSTNTLTANGPFVVQSASLNGKGKYQNGLFILSESTMPLFGISEIINVESISETEAKNFIAKVGWGTAAFIGLGTIFSGGLGLLGAGAALIATGNNKRLSFLVTLRSGSQYIISASDKIYLEIKASLL